MRRTTAAAALAVALLAAVTLTAPHTPEHNKNQRRNDNGKSHR